MTQRKRRFPVSLALVSFAFGLLSAAQFRAVHQRGNNVAFGRAEDLLAMLQNAERARRNLEQEVQTLRGRLEKYEGSSAEGKDMLEAIREELQEARLAAGLLPLQGPGVSVTLQDSSQAAAPGEDPNQFIVHQEDLLLIINEMNASGAEAIAINDQRLVAYSEVRCVGPTVIVNGSRLAPPYVIRAIGDPEILHAALTMRGGVIETLKIIGLRVAIQKEKNVTLPPYTGGLRLHYGKPVEKVAQ